MGVLSSILFSTSTSATPSRPKPIESKTSVMSSSAMHHNLEILCVLVTDTSEVLGRVVCMPMARDSYVSIFLTDFANAMSHLIPNHIRPSQLIPWRPPCVFPYRP